MFKKVKWLCLHITNIVLESILSIFIKKDKNLLLFGSKPCPPDKDVFLNSSKYLFLYPNQTKFQTILLCDDEAMLKIFKSNGTNNVCKRNSLRGIWAKLRAKYWFCDFSANQVSKFNSVVNTNIDYMHISEDIHMILCHLILKVLTGVN